jgi:glycosyltransferase involved in cell wall biosynthesis
MLTAHRVARTWHRAVDVFVALTDFAREKLVAGGLPAERIVVKPNFVDPDPGVGAHDGGFALFVGRLAPEKGLDVLIAAWPLVRAAHPDARLVLIGEGPERPALEARVARLGLRGAVALPGSSADPVAALRDADLFVLPSRTEGLPRALVEAMARALPCLGSRVGGIPELLPEEDLVEPDDVPGLA